MRFRLKWGRRGWKAPGMLGSGGGGGEGRGGAEEGEEEFGGYVSVVSRIGPTEGMQHARQVSGLLAHVTKESTEEAVVALFVFVVCCLPIPVSCFCCPFYGLLL